MSDDRLREASQALREVTAENHDSERFTRARIMASLHQRRRSRSARVAYLVPLAAILVGSTAFAGATGRLPAVWSAVTEVVGIEATPAADEAIEPAPITHRWVAHLPTDGLKSLTKPERVPEAALEPEPESEPEPEPAVSVKVGSAPKPTGPDEHLLYRAAHRAHFGGSDSAAALSAWDEYLRVAPRGRFATEARYNRAICLVRLGRRAEASAALMPFARGAYGGYRQQDAEKLLGVVGQPVEGPDPAP